MIVIVTATAIATVIATVIATAIATVIVKVIAIESESTELHWCWK